MRKKIAVKSIVRTLIISVLCILLVVSLLFFPYVYYSSLSTSSDSSFTVGMHYNYVDDEPGEITAEVGQIAGFGCRIIRITVQCDPTNPSAEINLETDEFYAATRSFNISVALVTLNRESISTIDYYFGRWGSELAYVQILNEPELSQSWDLGTLFTDDEIISYFQQIYNLVLQHNLQAELYTNFEPAYLLRANVPIHLSENLDFVGFDVYMQSFLMLSPHFINLLHDITGKEVVITEFGMSTNDDQTQSDFLLEGLSLFKNMGLSGCWLVYWNSESTFYGIRGRLAEQTVGEWIAQNAS